MQKVLRLKLLFFLFFFPLPPSRLLAFYHLKCASQLSAISQSVQRSLEWMNLLCTSAVALRFWINLYTSLFSLKTEFEEQKEAELENLRRSFTSEQEEKEQSYTEKMSQLTAQLQQLDAVVAQVPVMHTYIYAYKYIYEVLTWIGWQWLFYLRGGEGKTNWAKWTEKMLYFYWRTGKGPQEDWGDAMIWKLKQRVRDGYTDCGSVG